LFATSTAQAQSSILESSYYIIRQPIFSDTGFRLPGFRDTLSSERAGTGGMVYIGRNVGESDYRSFAEFSISLYKGLPGEIDLGMTYFDREAAATFVNGVAVRPPFVGTVTVYAYDPVPGAKSFDPVVNGVAATLDAGVPFGFGVTDTPLPKPRYNLNITDAITAALQRGQTSIGLEFRVDGPSFVPNEYRLTTAPPPSLRLSESL